MNKFNIAVVGFLLVGSLSAQKNKAPDNWYLLDPKADKVYGTGIEEAYKTLGDRKVEKVIVAVIDSGVDVEHEDLKDVLWTNPGEIAGNGIDDDNNGYIDDIHGWSFLGGETEDLNEVALELTRLYQRYSVKYDGKKSSDFSGAEREEYNYWKTIKKDYMVGYSQDKNQGLAYPLIETFFANVKKDKGSFSKESIASYEPQNDMERSLKPVFKELLEAGMPLEDLEEQIASEKKHFETKMAAYSVNDDSLRRAIIGDNPDDVTEKYYGCNRLEGPDALHGTHVAGIIAANRVNNLGIIGEANNVEIMTLRAVPNGDERDKDIANAIIYAVDNGAKVINMSFGKGYTPHKGIVDNAIKYAADHDVLLVHAAGNDHKNKEVDNSYPTRLLSDGTIAANWIDVGASSFKKGKNIPASFSNYGPTMVDLFAPGVAIHSTLPDDEYRDLQGTSMACPSVAGVAAMIRGYFPELTAAELKILLIETCTIYKKKVYLPGGATVENKKGEKVHKDVKVKMTDLCVSGGMINANNAVKKLLELEGK
jgi:subtilisin family serine protease